MDAYRIEATVQPGGTLIVRGLPFPSGRVVEVIVLEHGEEHPPAQDRLAGMPIVYINPTEPVAMEDWEASS